MSSSLEILSQKKSRDYAVNKYHIASANFKQTVFSFLSLSREVYF